MSEIRLSAPRLAVTLGDPEKPDTWQQYEVQTVNRDQILAEEEFMRSKRGDLQKRPILLLTMIAYNALRRTNAVTAGSFADFEQGCIDLQSVEDTRVDPTQLEAETG